MAANPTADSKTLQHLQLPGENAAYRSARNKLLAEEMELRRQIERVAARRRAPMLNVFHRDGNTIRHFRGSELLYVPPEPGQQYRHNDLLDPLWDMLDVTPQGRGDFEPKLEYPPR
ncbi:MAG: DUF899 family protein [Pseudomonadota bacterium]|nr:DUF899 family protein [Pseudomonadota bacterium]